MTTDVPVNAWSTSQLVEYLAVLSEQPDEANARRAAIERVLESLDAEVGVLFGAGNAPVAVGLPADDPDLPALIDAVSGDSAAAQGCGSADVAGLGKCRSAVVALTMGDDPVRLLVTRAGPAEFQPDEMLLLRGMAWVLALALRPLRTSAELAERQQVLEQMGTVQRAIAGRTPLPEIFDLVTAGLLSLAGADMTMLYLGGKDGLVAVSGAADDERFRPLLLGPRTSGIAHQAYTSERVVRTDDYASLPHPLPEIVALGATAAMAVPVTENGQVVGALTVISSQQGRRFTDIQEQSLRTFADQVSIALSDAKTLATAQRAIRDPVTGLPNRLYFLDTLQQALDKGLAVYVLFLDLDRFKLVNDTLGHAAGDDLLRQIGRRLRESMRCGDLLARFGGDEYAVLMEDADEEAVNGCGKRMLAAVQESYLIGPEDVVVGGSIGVASGEDRATASEVMRDADTAMYQAKHAGGGRLVRFEQPMHTAVVRRHSIEADLRRAVSAKALAVALQPIVRLRDEHLWGAEALARWHHPTRGGVPPTEFIPLAEETGLIVPLGRHILATACAHATGWPVPADGRLAADVTVNISPRQLMDESFVADLRAILRETGLDPRRLVLELTESTIARDLDCVLDLMRRIRDQGVRLAIDDFGTGYSSLSYLRMFPVDILKIDRSFVESIGAPWQGTAFVRAIVRLTEALSMTVIAEGVETQEQARALAEVGCHIGQGYLFSPPLPAGEFPGYAREHAATDDPR